MAAPLKKIVDNDKLVDDDREGQRFRVSRTAFVSKEILARERTNIFDKVWLYLGHESELAKPGDFLTRAVAGRQMLFTRDNKNKFHALMNTCAHRGARVCRERIGNAKSFQCFYHGWVFGLDGTLRDLPGKESYPLGFHEHPSSNLKAAPRFDSYRGFCFISFNPNVESLPDYLGNAKEYIDIVADQSEAGMTVVGGTQEYAIRANWKLLTENSIDGYHGAINHATYLEYLQNTTGGFAMVQIGGVGRDLGKGHGVIEYRAPWGRPVAQWIPAWGDDGKKRIDDIYNALVSRHGKERADRIALYNRNLHVFPNLIINDIMALTIRTYHPLEPDHMAVNAWALAPVQENADDRMARLFNFLEFLGPGGLATPDDIEALEQCQQGYSNRAETGWNDISKGLTRETPAFDDEAQMRGYWTEWNRRMYGG